MTDKKWTGVIGLMSGTSIDGLDCCYVEFSNENGRYQFRNLLAKTYPYTDTWLYNLKNAFYLVPQELATLDFDYGVFLAEKVKTFIEEHKLNGKVRLIASHGHTVFHDPAQNKTLQIGHGSQLNILTGIDVICDFRTKDVELGGQGAPLVPVGDHFLFPQYQACLNLGGFSNISFISDNERVAFDIGPCNLPVNQLCKEHFNLEYDKDGAIAASGQVIPALLAELNALPYYSLNPPKSLGFEWLSGVFQPVLKRYEKTRPQDLVCTVTEHVASQICTVLENQSISQVLVTGGGAYNKYLINILKKGKAEIILPPAEIIEFKEALIFAFLGYLNLNNSINTFKSVTGAREDSMGGVRYFGHEQ